MHKRLLVVAALLAAMVRGQTCQAGDDCSSPAFDTTPNIGTSLPGAAAETPKETRKQQRLGALNAEIAEMTKLVSASQTKLKLLERKRRLLFPHDEIPPAPPGDDFSPSLRPLVKELPVITSPEGLQQLLLLPTPLVTPPKGSRGTDKLLGACLLTASSDGALGFYDALGQPVKETDLSNDAAANPVTALAAASTGKHGLVSVGFQNGSISLFEVTAMKKMDFKVFHLWKERNHIVLPGTSIPSKQPAVTSMTVHLASKSAVVFAGDTAGDIHLHTNQAKGYVTTVSTLNVTGNKSESVGVIECCVVKQVAIGVAKQIAFLDTRTLLLAKCFDADIYGTVTSVVVSSNSLLFAIAGNFLLSLKISPNAHRGRRLPDAILCSLIYSRELKPDKHRLFLLKNYLLVHSSKESQVTLFNASRMREVGPWPVLPLAVDAAPAPWFVSTDGVASFVVGQAGGKNMSLWHTELPQPHKDTGGWEMPGRPVIIVAAVLMVFGWKYFGKGRSKGKESKEPSDEFEYGGAGGSGRGLRAGRGGFSGARGGARGSKDMNEMAAMEDRINMLGKTTAELGNLMGSVKGIATKAPVNRNRNIHPVKREIMASDY